MNSPKKLVHDYLKPEVKRNLEHDSFYSSRPWRRVRAAFKAAHPLCVECEKNGVIKEMEVVDHIKPRRLGGADLKWENLQSLCKYHHDVKSSQEGREKRYKTSQNTSK